MNEIITIDGVKYKRIEENPQPKYAVGDWVKVIANKSARLERDSYIDEITKITCVYDYGYYKRNGEPMQAYSIGETWVVYEDELEPAEEPKQDPFDIKNGDKYFYILPLGCVDSYTYYEDSTDKKLVKVANYCKDEELMTQRAMHETLNRLLWRASVQAGELNNPWDYNHDHWEIYCTCDGKFTVARSCNDKYYGIYFPTEKSAQSALDNIVKPFMEKHPDFVW